MAIWQGCLPVLHLAHESDIYSFQATTSAVALSLLVGLEAAVLYIAYVAESTRGRRHSPGRLRGWISESPTRITRINAPLFTIYYKFITQRILDKVCLQYALSLLCVVMGVLMAPSFSHDTELIGGIVAIFVTFFMSSIYLPLYDLRMSHSTFLDSLPIATRHWILRDAAVVIFAVFSVVVPLFAYLHLQYGFRVIAGSIVLISLAPTIYLLYFARNSLDIHGLVGVISVCFVWSLLVLPFV